MIGHDFTRSSGQLYLHRFHVGITAILRSLTLDGVIDAGPILELTPALGAAKGRFSGKRFDQTMSLFCAKESFDCP
jgi:hypothetical protein